MPTEHPLVWCFVDHDTGLDVSAEGDSLKEAAAGAGYIEDMDHHGQVIYRRPSAPKEDA